MLFERFIGRLCGIICDSFAISIATIRNIDVGFHISTVRCY